jgi:hypothetical protein
MLLSFRRAAIPEIGASVATKAFVHTAYRVHLIHNERVVCDDELFLPSITRIGRLARPVLTVILAGRARMRSRGFERWLEPGDVMLLPIKAVVAMRQEGAPFRSIAIEWDAGSLGDGAPAFPDGARLGPVRCAQIDALAHTLEGCEDQTLAGTILAEVLALLRAEGAPFADLSAHNLIETTPNPVIRLSHALDVVLSRLEQGPGLVDLDAALGLSPRQINRVVTEFNRRYGFNSLGWRDTRNRRRLLVGATMMTAPDARTELVARAMGYSSPTGFCHALALADLPSPGATADVVAKLR